MDYKNLNLSPRVDRICKKNIHTFPFCVYVTQIQWQNKINAAIGSFYPFEPA